MASGIATDISLITENPNEQVATVTLYLILSCLGCAWLLLQQFGDTAYPN